MANDNEKRAEIDAALDAALARLPRRAAPAALQQRIRQQFAEPTPPRRSRGWIPPLLSAFAAAALVVVAVRFVPPARDAGAPASAEMVTEAVNDHLRVVSSSRPVEIESGGIHQVKPWFTGRLEFAPRVAFSGDDDFPLVGGSIGYFRDRKAAVFVFKRRLHTITLLVFPAGGLPWPAGGQTPVGRLSVSEQDARGFSVLLWQDAGLGYALVSDVNRHDLELLAARINPER
jgi:anti-sigma factor RsiW